MPAIAKVLSHTLVDTRFAVEAPKSFAKTFAVFCGVTLTVFSLVASYGIDLSPGFF